MVIERIGQGQDEITLRYASKDVNLGKQCEEGSDRSLGMGPGAELDHNAPLHWASMPARVATLSPVYSTDRNFEGTVVMKPGQFETTLDMPIVCNTQFSVEGMMRVTLEVEKGAASVGDADTVRKPRTPFAHTGRRRALSPRCRARSSLHVISRNFRPLLCCPCSSTGPTGC